VGIQEQIEELGREYTPQYMSIDPGIAALDRKKKMLEDQIRRKRSEGEDLALAQAQQDLAAARQSVASIQQQLDEQKKVVMEFTTRFAEHEALQEELVQLETQYREVQQRQVQMDVNKKKLYSQVTLRVPPFVPERPVYPYYLRDAGISVAASFLLALLAVLFFDFMNRPSRGSAVTSIQPVFVSTPDRAALERTRNDHLPYMQTPRALEQQSLRELSGEEVLAQLGVAVPETQLLIALLSSGMTPDELPTLRWGDIDLDTGILHIHNHRNREMAVSQPLRAAIEAYRPPDPELDTPVWQDTAGGALTDNDIEGLIACAAHDAGVTRPSEINAKTFLHTYLAYLARKGVRLSDLGKVAGNITPQNLAAYGVYSPPGMALSLESIDPVYPALETFFRTESS
jgi:succinoglycan biosynthesis transport protein ExoP